MQVRHNLENEYFEYGIRLVTGTSLKIFIVGIGDEQTTFVIFIVLLVV